MKQDVQDILDNCKSRKLYTLLGTHFYELTSNINGKKLSLAKKGDKVFLNGNLIEDGGHDDVAKKVEEIKEIKIAEEVIVQTMEELKDIMVTAVEERVIDLKPDIGILLSKEIPTEEIKDELSASDASISSGDGSIEVKP